ncbi:MAG: hypothetical protein M3Y18_05105 [Candidatus Eremiobacteraeota bacterium]|nr:hypothetical protein [Candidatus Eremiobacteraeota bacterium]
MLRAAEQECRNHNHYYVGAEHLLLALLAEHDPGVLEHLRVDGIEMHEVYSEVRRALGTGEDRVWEGILVTPRVRKIVALAETSAGDADVEPGHLYQAMRLESGSLAAEILRRAATHAAGHAPK